MPERIRRKQALTLFAGVLFSLVLPCAQADSVFVGAYERSGLKVQTYRNGQLEFTIDGRRVDPVQGERIARIVLDNDPVFTQADKAFADGSWSEAAAGYAQVLQTTSRPWLKTWILPRLTQSADHCGRFDLAIQAFAQLLQADPQQAIRLQPSIPAVAEPTALKSASEQLQAASTNPNLTDTQKLAILSLLLRTELALGDLTSADAVGRQLTQIARVDPSDPANNRALAAMHLAKAQLAFSHSDYPKAAIEIQANQALFADPVQQAEALYCVATAHDRQPGTSATPEGMKDLALEYMRVVAITRTTWQKRYLPESLLRVAQLEEQLGDTKVALALYGELASEYKGSPLAIVASQGQQRLAAKAKEN